MVLFTHLEAGITFSLLMLPALIPLALLEAVQNIDTPIDDGLGALNPELATRRLGLSPTVAAQIERYRSLARNRGEVDLGEVIGVFRLVGRRPDADLVYADAGRRAARLLSRYQGAAQAALLRLVPTRWRERMALHSAAQLTRLWLRIEARALDGEVRCEMTDTPALLVREDGVACRFYTAALAETLRVVAGFEGVVLHQSCCGRGDRCCLWRARPAEGMNQ